MFPASHFHRGPSLSRDNLNNRMLFFVLEQSPYGKTGTGPQSYDSMAPFRVGLEKNRTLGYENFEAPDPAEWTLHGYAIVNVDARAGGDSESNISFWGQHEAEDIYDIIELVHKAAVVFRLGHLRPHALSHPALKALAPWEGFTDLYRDLVLRSGRPHNENSTQ
ncbi:uncharacterized protein BP01DRAFT_424893 [Aspergillus saccharolyticus JOP 1030-1]|uniref:Xaa-Pro dipeptidyl-peptidase-like domain-containing protein n=1 Tax=Aspergillus saccharolyticus JOP 1030-1 TaxID=1450539 RepID=A0A318Z7R3_9EURO|nr:hypothetical protein BP01DRAFT_424893 [Aspergillus saccharolyticus JOP 1030-1]PYH43345.1 hypothetical protein BP01DRAFT_424893 [Aspergillus saccharolyticus JOP 1030-1]